MDVLILFWSVVRNTEMDEKRSSRRSEPAQKMEGKNIVKDGWMTGVWDEEEEEKEEQEESHS